MRTHSLNVPYQYWGLYLAWWWLNEPKHVVEFLILITNVRCVIDEINVLYYRKTRVGFYLNFPSVYVYDQTFVCTYTFVTYKTKNLNQA